MFRILSCVASLSILLLTGCYAPLKSPGIPASTLPDSFRMPTKRFSNDLNFAMLTQPVPVSYRLGPKDQIQVEIANLNPRFLRLGQVAPETAPGVTSRNLIQVELDESGRALLPLIGSVSFKGKTISEARLQLIAWYSDGYLDDPKVSVTLISPATTRVLVLGEVANPGVFELPKYENDIAHAIALAGGLILESADEITVHRRQAQGQISPAQYEASEGEVSFSDLVDVASPSIIRIPLRSTIPVELPIADVVLENGNVVVVNKCAEEAFFVVGLLNPNGLVRFSLGTDNRDLGNGFTLPKDRDIDVVTAVAMAGYIDPIDSPTTVTVHRTRPNGSPMLIRVDLIQARYNRAENIMVQGGDIIYLNPDPAWWCRRTFDRIVPSVFTAPYFEAMQRWINPGRFN
ncbi:MAG: polysaccharide biosynthesis/export family protein [Rubripirellula sp.]|jgi:polysaccharide export outer membrane protein